MAFGRSILHMWQTTRERLKNKLYLASGPAETIVCEGFVLHRWCGPMPKGMDQRAPNVGFKPGLIAARTIAFDILHHMAPHMQRLQASLQSALVQIPHWAPFTASQFPVFLLSTMLSNKKAKMPYIYCVYKKKLTLV